MTAQTFSLASVICLPRHQRAAMMRETSARSPAADATEFRQGMHADAPLRHEHRLKRNQMFSLPAQDLTLLCLSGELWLTRDGDIEDYILGPGQSMSVGHADQAAVQALRPSQLRLIPAA